VVGPASVSRRHERPSRMAVSRRSGKSRPPRSAARLQARVGSGSASPPPVEPTNLASALSLLPVWPGAPCVCWPTRRCCHAGTPPVGGHSAQLPRDPRPLPHSAGERDTNRKPVRRGLVLLGGAAPPTGRAASALRCQVADSPDRKKARLLPTLGGVEPPLVGSLRRRRARFATRL
jgi:hypothetical protein